MPYNLSGGSAAAPTPWGIGLLLVHADATDTLWGAISCGNL